MPKFRIGIDGERNRFREALNPSIWASVAAITVATIAMIAVSAKRPGAAPQRRPRRRRRAGDARHGIRSRRLVLLFGVGLLFGYVAVERVTCF
jgi:hypothetical protein